MHVWPKIFSTYNGSIRIYPIVSWVRTVYANLLRVVTSGEGVEGVSVEVVKEDFRNVFYQWF